MLDVQGDLAIDPLDLGSQGEAGQARARQVRSNRQVASIYMAYRHVGRHIRSMHVVRQARGNGGTWKGRHVGGRHAAARRVAGRLTCWQARRQAGSWADRLAGRQAERQMDRQAGTGTGVACFAASPTCAKVG